MRFVLLGSSTRKLKQVGVNLLAGRALRKQMFPLLPEELATDFDVERILTVGSLPLVWQSASPLETLEAYVQLYLKEEIRAEALVRNLPAFSRFLPVAALAHGQVVNTSGLARDAAAARNTVEGYIEILEDTLMLTGLKAISALKRVKRRILIYEGMRQLTTPDGIEVLPVRSFVKLLEERTL